jgi:hypothetical protein
MRNQSGLHQDDRRSGPPRLRAKSGRRAETHLWRKRKLAAECVRVVWNCGNTATMEAARHTPGGSERPSRHPRRARNPPYCRPVAPADNTPLTHGELPCPNCGYQRRGLELERPCPECGARGFDGELIVSGLPGVEPESKRSRSLYRIAGYLFVIASAVLPLVLGRGTSAYKSSKNAAVAVALALFGAALLVYVSGRIRRRRDRAANLSLERIVMEFRREVVVIRDHADERRVPLRSIRAIRIEVDNPTAKTRVWISTSRDSPYARSPSPAIVLAGGTESQRAATAEMERRVDERYS